MDAQVHKHCSNICLSAAFLRLGFRPTGDLIIASRGVELQFIKLHSFLESWQIRFEGLQFSSTLGGEVNQWQREQ